MPIRGRPAVLPCWLVYAVVALCLGSCGRRGDPLPPGKRLPGAPSELSLSAPDGQLTLSWAAPREDLAGRTVLPLGGYAILRQAWSPGANSCETCPEELSLVGTLDAEERRARRLPETSWIDVDAKPGWTYRYRVRALDTQKRPGPLSGPATLHWTPLASPAVEAVAGDGQVTLRVKAQQPGGVQADGMRAYGGPNGGRLAEAAAGAAEFVVSGLPNGTPVILNVRLVGRTPEGWEIESPGTPITVTPMDTTPPFPPTDLVAFAESDGVELRWLPSGKERYARIAVLRATETGRFEEIATLPGDAVAYQDASAARATVYRYALAAIDAAGNRSLPAREARVRVP